MNYFIADPHFWHKSKKGGIIEYCNRPFPNVEAMNGAIIERWNATVKENNDIYIVGDFSMCGVKATRAILEQLNGRKHLIVGDHDKSALKCKEHFVSIADRMFVSVNGQGIFLSHYCHKVWRKSHYGTWHLFGHSHGGLNEYATKEGKLLDVGVDSHDFRPWSFEQVAEVMATRPDNFNRVKGRY